MLNEWLTRQLFFPLWELKDGAHRLHYLRELTDSQWLDPQTLQQRQWQRLTAMVSYAVRYCHYYDRTLGGLLRNGRLESWEDFRRLPILTKGDIRAQGAGLLSRQFDPGQLVEARTGGSTGTALTVHFDEDCQQMRNAAAMRADRWAGWEIGLKVAAVWGNPPVAGTLKEKLRNRLLDRLIYLDTMDISEATVRDFVRAWRAQRPQMLFGHAHSLYILARYLEQLGLTTLRPRGIVATSMMLLEPERRVIERVFGCPVTNRYGCEEVGLIACECEQHRGLHLNVDHLVVEFLGEDGSQARPGEEALIVVTDLINRGMPLIRYRIEDLGVPSDRPCPCGRGLPLMERVVGRQADFLKRPDGSLVAGVSLVERTLTAIAGIEQMQLVQQQPQRLEVRVVRDGHYDQQTEQLLRRELGRALGPTMTLDIRYVNALDRTPGGKYRFAICTV